MKKFLIVCAVLFFGMVACTGVVASIATSNAPTDDTTLSIGETDTNAEPATEHKSKPKLSAARQNAIRSAENYVSLSGFSRAGLIQQLSSSAGEGFKRSDAEYAVDHIKVDWNAEAVESGQGYLDMSGFSRAGLIQQLHSKAGDGYTLKQATYAANKLGL